jgi:hypothetical protein
MSEPGGSIKNPEHEAENPAPMPEGAERSKTPTAIEGPEKPTDPAGQQGGMHWRGARLTLRYESIPLIPFSPSACRGALE